MFNGWARIFAGTSGRSPWPTLTALTLLIATGVAWAISMALIGRPGWAWIGPVHGLAMCGFFAWCYRAAGVNIAALLALPLSLAMVLAVLVNSLRVCFTGRVDWRGNAVRVTRS
jgi:hypothetical protein